MGTIFLIYFVKQFVKVVIVLSGAAGASIKGAYEKGVFPFQFQSAKLCFIKVNVKLVYLKRQ